MGPSESHLDCLSRFSADHGCDQQSHTLTHKKLVTSSLYEPSSHTHTHTHTHARTHARTHIHTRLTALCPVRKGKTNLDFTEARDSEWRKASAGPYAVWTSLQTDNQSCSPRDRALGLEIVRDRNSAVLVLVLKHCSRLFSRPINN